MCVVGPRTLVGMRPRVCCVWGPGGSQREGRGLMCVVKPRTPVGMRPRVCCVCGGSQREGRPDMRSQASTYPCRYAPMRV